MSVFAVVDDLFFRSKLESAANAVGVPLHLSADGSTFATAHRARPIDLILIDLNLTGQDAVVIAQALRTTAPQVPVVAFFSHVQTDLEQRAKDAGCAMVLPRSVFVRRLPELLAGSLGVGR